MRVHSRWHLNSDFPIGLEKRRCAQRTVCETERSCLLPASRSLQLALTPECADASASSHSGEGVLQGACARAPAPATALESGWPRPVLADPGQSWGGHLQASPFVSECLSFGYDRGIQLAFNLPMGTSSHVRCRTGIGCRADYLALRV